MLIFIGEVEVAVVEERVGISIIGGKIRGFKIGVGHPEGKAQKDAEPYLSSRR
jgi:hypothetical protein